MRRILKTSAVDIVVLDIMMPGEDGLSLCRMLRETTDIPVILLTAMAEETDRVVGLEIGADDYVIKPFNPRELLARIRAVLRRAQALPKPREAIESTRLAFDRWTLDPARRELVGEDGVSVPLSTAEFRLLTVFLAPAADRPLARPAPRPDQRPLARAVRALGRQPGEPAQKEDRGRSKDPGDRQDGLGRRLRVLRRRQGNGILKFPRLLPPTTLGGQLLALLLVALVVSQVASFLVLVGDRAEAVRAADRSGFLRAPRR